ncbi:MAG: inorganic diphosphatase [Patescibacteria group bacterium]
MTISKATDYLGKIVTIIIDRPLYSKHQKHGFIYELNYGFVPNTLSPDGEELDAYVIGPNLPLKTFKGICIAVIHRTNDDDDKLIITPIETANISDEEIRRQTNFQEKYFKSVIIRDNY